MWYMFPASHAAFCRKIVDRFAREQAKAKGEPGAKSPDREHAPRRYAFAGRFGMSLLEGSKLLHT